MATVSDLADTFDSPNFVGPLFGLFPDEAPLLTMAGGLAPGGGEVLSTYDITWQTETNAAPGQLSLTEGHTPAYRSETRTEVTNVTQIFSRGVQVSWTKQSATSRLGDYASSRAWSVMGNQPVQDEFAHQIQNHIIHLRRSMNWHLWNSAYQRPTDNTTGRQTRGLIAAATTNANDEATAVGNCTFDVTGGAQEDLWELTAHGLNVGDEVRFNAVGTGAEGYAIDTPYWVVSVANADDFQLSATKGGSVLAGTGSDSSGTWTLEKSNQLTRAMIEGAIQGAADAANPAPFRQPVLFVGGAYNKQRISELYGFAPQSRTLGGVSIDTIMLDVAGNVPVVYDRDLAAQRVFIAEMSVIKPRWMLTKTRDGVQGVFFYKDLYSEATDDRGTLYGDMGLEYGPEAWHVHIDGLTTVA